MLIFIFLQLNTSVFLQSIGLTIVQSLASAPIYGLAMYWGIKFAFSSIEKEKRSTQTRKMENKD